MSKFKRYGFQLNDLGKDPDETFVRHGVGVPAKYTTTPSRTRSKKIFRVIGLICFICTLVSILGLIGNIYGWVNETVFQVIGPALGGLFFVSHLGFFFEMWLKPQS